VDNMNDPQKKSEELADRIASTMDLDMTGATAEDAMACIVLAGRMVGRRASSTASLIQGLSLLTRLMHTIVMTEQVKGRMMQ